MDNINATPTPAPVDANAAPVQVMDNGYGAPQAPQNPNTPVTYDAHTGAPSNMGMPQEGNFQAPEPAPVVYDSIGETQGVAEYSAKQANTAYIKTGKVFSELMEKSPDTIALAVAIGNNDKAAIAQVIKRAGLNLDEVNIDELSGSYDSKRYLQSIYNAIDATEGPQEGAAMAPEVNAVYEGIKATPEYLNLFNETNVALQNIGPGNELSKAVENLMSKDIEFAQSMAVVAGQPGKVTQVFNDTIQLLNSIKGSSRVEAVRDVSKLKSIFKLAIDKGTNMYNPNQPQYGYPQQGGQPQPQYGGYPQQGNMGYPQPQYGGYPQNPQQGGQYGAQQVVPMSVTTPNMVHQPPQQGGAGFDSVEALVDYLSKSDMPASGENLHAMLAKTKIN